MRQKVDPRNWVLRLFSLSWGGLFVLLALFLEKITPDTSVWIGALTFAGVLCLGLVWPRMMRMPYRVVESVGRPVGEVVSFLVLGAVFFGVFTPYALLLRLTRRDPLRLGRTSQDSSAWSDWSGNPSPSNFFWQY